MEQVANVRRKLGDLFYDLKETIRREGWLEAGRELVKTLASVPYRRMAYIVFTRPLSDALPDATPKLPVTLRRATEADLVRFEGLVPAWELRYFRRRLARGRYCFLALDGERLAAYCWATTQVEFDVDNLEMQLQEGDVYLDDAYTVPAYRRQGIQTAVHMYRLAYMRDLGCQRAVLIVEEPNVASQGLVRKLGYEATGYLAFRRWLWIRDYRYQPNDF
jgi:ribosomal protein S18 acetylase RimI-like enzyme